MRRSPFPATPFSSLPEGGAEHPLPMLLAFLMLALAVGFSWTWSRLAVAAAGAIVFLLLPRPGGRPWRLLLGFSPLLVVVFILHLFPWRGFAAGFPFAFDGTAWPRGLMAFSRFGLWILLSARALEGLHPAALMARLPSKAVLARWALVPVMAFGFLDLFLREAFHLEKAWRSRGGARGGLRAAAWPALLLPLFRGMITRADTLAESLAIRRFPERWAGGRPLPWRPASLVRMALAALVLAAVWLQRAEAGA